MRFNWELVGKLRKAAGLSQYGLARRIGVSSTYIQNLERGKVRHPGDVYVTRLAEVFGVQVTAFYIPLAGTEEDLAGVEERDGEGHPMEKWEMEELALLRILSGRVGPEQAVELLERIYQLDVPQLTAIRALIDSFAGDRGEGDSEGDRRSGNPRRRRDRASS